MSASFRFLPRQISAFVPRTTASSDSEYRYRIGDTLDQYDYTIEQQRTPIIYFQKAFKYIEENNYDTIRAKLAISLPNYKQNFWYTRYPSEFIIVGGKDGLPKPYSERPSHSFRSAYDDILEDILVTRIWFDQANTNNNEQDEVNVLMERGNFIYRYLLGINQHHRFQFPPQHSPLQSPQHSPLHSPFQSPQYSSLQSPLPIPQQSLPQLATNC